MANGNGVSPGMFQTALIGVFGLVISALMTAGLYRMSAVQDEIYELRRELNGIRCQLLEVERNKMDKADFIAFYNRLRQAER
jgi:hypothetical protein